jgi:4-methyl-5(b-hydroxyethyl)-thiazole monophosphate biosynthesis
MAAPTVLVVLADEFEEIEAVTSIDILRRAGAVVTVAALGEGIHVTGRGGIVVHADTALSSVEASLFSCILLPGGPGVARLRADARVPALVRRHHQAGAWVAAICAAPVVLKDAGLLATARHTAHFSVSADLPGALLDERVVSDGLLITSRGAGTALEFALCVVEKLFSSQRSSEVSRSISV